MNPKNSTIISPETVELNVDYAITFAPSDEYQYFGTPEREESLHGYMKTFVLRIVPALLKLQMEISRSGRLHYHGTIKFFTIAQVKTFFVSIINKLLKKFQIEIDTIKDPKIWQTYMYKSKSMFPNGYIETNKTFLKDLNKFNSVKYLDVLAPSVPDGFAEPTAPTVALIVPPPPADKERGIQGDIKDKNIELSGSQGTTYPPASKWNTLHPTFLASEYDYNESGE